MAKAATLGEETPKATRKTVQATFQGVTFVTVDIEENGQQTNREESRVEAIYINFQDKKDAAKKFAEFPWLAETFEKFSEVVANQPVVDLTLTESVERNVNDAIVTRAGK